MNDVNFEELSVSEIKNIITNLELEVEKLEFNNLKKRLIIAQMENQICLFFN